MSFIIFFFQYKKNIYTKNQIYFLNLFIYLFRTSNNEDNKKIRKIKIIAIIIAT